MGLQWSVPDDAEGLLVERWEESTEEVGHRAEGVCGGRGKVEEPEKSAGSLQDWRGIFVHTHENAGATEFTDQIDARSLWEKGNLCFITEAENKYFM